MLAKLLPLFLEDPPRHRSELSWAWIYKNLIR